MGTGTKVAGARARFAAALALASQVIHLWALPGEFAARPLLGSFVCWWRSAREGGFMIGVIVVGGGPACPPP